MQVVAKKFLANAIIVGRRVGSRCIVYARKCRAKGSEGPG
jgi:hypothetical protein